MYAFWSLLLLGQSASTAMAPKVLKRPGAHVQCPLAKRPAAKQEPAEEEEQKDDEQEASEEEVMADPEEEEEEKEEDPAQEEGEEEMEEDEDGEAEQIDAVDMSTPLEERINIFRNAAEGLDNSEDINKITQKMFTKSEYENMYNNECPGNSEEINNIMQDMCTKNEQRNMHNKLNSDLTSPGADKAFGDSNLWIVKLMMLPSMI